MLANIGGEILIIFVLLLANGFFAGSEIAIVSARRSRLEALSDKGNQRAQQAIDLAEKPDRFLATVQVGITLIGTFSAAFGGARISDVLAEQLSTIPTLAESAEALSLAIVVGSLTYGSLIIGELVPKRLALRNAESFALVAAPVMQTIAFVARPIVGFLALSVNLILRILGQNNNDDEAVTPDDIAFMVREGLEAGTVEQQEAQIIHRVFAFNDRPVREMMTPRPQLVAINVNTSYNDIMTRFQETQFSRLPVYEGTSDHIIGVIFLKDVVHDMMGNPDQNIRSIMRPPVFVVESAHGDDVLDELREKQARMAFVVGEYGEIVGVVTLKDLIEELVGDLHDMDELSTEPPIVTRADGSWLVDAQEPLDRVASEIGFRDNDNADYHSLAGLIMTRLERIPQTGDIIHEQGFIFEVVDMDGRRVDKVLIRKDEDKG